MSYYPMTPTDMEYADMEWFEIDCDHECDNLDKTENLDLIQNDTCILMFLGALFIIPRHGSNLNAYQQRNG